MTEMLRIEQLVGQLPFFVRSPRNNAWGAATEEGHDQSITKIFSVRLDFRRGLDICFSKTDFELAALEYYFRRVFT